MALIHGEEAKARSRALFNAFPSDQRDELLEDAGFEQRLQFNGDRDRCHIQNPDNSDKESLLSLP